VDHPNPLGADGYPAPGEPEHAERIVYGMPDLTDPAVRARYAGRHVAVAGAGASAQNVLVALARLARDVPATRVSWLVRRGEPTFGGGDNDQLVERGALGRRAQRVAESTVVSTLTTFRAAGADSHPDGRLSIGPQTDVPNVGDCCTSKCQTTCPSPPRLTRCRC
jgi:hypothetical protein